MCGTCSRRTAATSASRAASPTSSRSAASSSIDGTRWSEDDLLPAVEAGAEDIVTDEDLLEVYTQPGDLAAVRAAIEAAGIEIESAEVIQSPSVRVELDEAQAGRLFRLIEALEDNDDVGAVHANFDVSADILERVAG